MTNPGADRDDFAKRLREARERAGMSQGQVARELQMHRPTITECEAGRRKVSAEELLQFAQLYRVSTAWLTGDVEPEAGSEIAVAAREIAKLKPKDREKLMEFLRSVSKGARPRL